MTCTQWPLQGNADASQTCSFFQAFCASSMPNLDDELCLVWSFQVWTYIPFQAIVADLCRISVSSFWIQDSLASISVIQDSFGSMSLWSCWAVALAVVVEVNPLAFVFFANRVEGGGGGRVWETQREREREREERERERGGADGWSECKWV